jgi:hypothetical protein
VQWGQDTSIVEWTEATSGNQWGQDTSVIEWIETTPENQWGQDASVVEWTETTPENQWGQDAVIDPVTGKIMESSEVGIDLHSAWSDAKILPTTGPEHVLMFIFALIFGAIAFVFKFRKS